MGASISIEEATEDDVYAIISLQAKIWQNACRSYLASAQQDYMFAKFYNPEALKQEMAAGQTYLILHENQILQGFASYSKVNGDSVRLNKIFILPESQGRGFGKKLMGYIENKARDDGAQTIILYVNRANTACALYKKLGYAVIAEVDIPIGPYVMHDYKMQKIFV